MAKNSKPLSKVLQTPAIAELITALDALGYELYIKPKPLRSKEQLVYQTHLDKQLRDSITQAATKQQERSNRGKKNEYTS